MSDLSDTFASQPYSATPDKWTPTHSWMIASFILGLFLENYIYSIAPIATGWIAMPLVLKSTLLSWAPLWLIIGIAAAGPVSDRVGRKKTFYITMTLYTIGAAGLLVSVTYWMLLVFLALMLAAAGGEMNCILAATHENMPAQHRSKAMMLEINFGIGSGGLLLGGLAFLSASAGVTFQRALLAGLVFVSVVALFYMRRRIPESVRWLESHGLHDRAREELIKYYGYVPAAVRTNARSREHSETLSSVRKIPPLWFRFAALIVIDIGSAFYLITYALGPDHFPKLTDLIIFGASATAIVAGCVAFWGDRLSRKLVLLVGFVGQTVAVILLGTLTHIWISSILVFWVLFVMYQAFNQVGYIATDTLKGEVWPTRRRGTYIAVVRFIAIGFSIITIYWTESFTLSQLGTFYIVLQMVGLAGAVAWFLWGHETGEGVSIGTASGEDVVGTGTMWVGAEAVEDSV